MNLSGMPHGLLDVVDVLHLFVDRTGFSAIIVIAIFMGMIFVLIRHCVLLVLVFLPALIISTSTSSEFGIVVGAGELDPVPINAARSA